MVRFRTYDVQFRRASTAVYILQTFSIRMKSQMQRRTQESIGNYLNLSLAVWSNSRRKIEKNRHLSSTFMLILKWSMVINNNGVFALCYKVRIILFGSSPATRSECYHVTKIQPR